MAKTYPPNLQTLSCPNCGGTLESPGGLASLLTCSYCGTSFRTPHSLTPEPDMGDLMLGADFRDPQVPGWVVINQDKVEFKKNGKTPELQASFKASKKINPVLRTPGPFEDFDVSVTVRLIKGSHEHIAAGLELRYSELGDYVIRISAQQTYQVGWHDGFDWGGTLVKWTTQPVLRDLGEPNRLRVIMRENRIRVYLNGVLSTSLRDDRYTTGLIRLVVSSTNSPVRAAFSDLQLRETK